MLVCTFYGGVWKSEGIGLPATPTPSIPISNLGERQKVYLGVLRVLLRGCDGDVQRCSVVPFAEKGLKLDKHHIPSLPTNIAKLKYDKNSN
eukprot:scaffold124493_cov14-Tisochrysis_lutea.AAC.1